jgi:BMFP domain-containing protein YqiC
MGHAAAAKTRSACHGCAHRASVGKSLHHTQASADGGIDADAVFLQMHRGDDMIDVHSIDQLAHRLATLVPPGLTQAREDMEANFRDVLAHGLRRLDLVTREEFDAQRAVLERAREQVAQLETRLSKLETKQQT